MCIRDRALRTALYKDSKLNIFLRNNAIQGTKIFNNATLNTAQKPYFLKRDTKITKNRIYSCCVPSNSLMGLFVFDRRTGEHEQIVKNVLSV